jgi:hypothetical protein
MVWLMVGGVGRRMSGGTAAARKLAGDCAAGPGAARGARGSARRVSGAPHAAPEVIP